MGPTEEELKEMMEGEIAEALMEFTRATSKRVYMVDVAAFEKDSESSEIVNYGVTAKVED